MDGRNSATRPWTAARLWLWWMAATTVGVVVAFAAFVAVFSIIGNPADPLFPIIMTGFGLVIGAFQQRVLRRGLADTRRWALATGFGLGAGIALVVAVGLGDTAGLVAQIAQGAAAGAVAGAVIGTLQWLVLRPCVPGSRWWVPASIGGWVTGVAAGDAVGYFAGGLDLVVAPMVAAALTGTALVRFLRARQDGASGIPALSAAASSPTDRPAPRP